MKAHLAERLRAAYTEGPIAPLRDEISDVAAAYKIQNMNIDYWLSQGRSLMGRKIGLTSTAVQQQLSVDQPDYGALFSDMYVASGESVSISRLLQPKIESEIAFVLAHDLDGPDVTLANVISAIDYMLPALEIVDSRIEKWDISLYDTIADNASSGLFVLGCQPVPLTAFPLPDVEMALRRNGAIVSIGQGRNCLGNPVIALHWLAMKMAELENPLKAGEVILAGALGPMVEISAGDHFTSALSGFETIDVIFE